MSLEWRLVVGLGNESIYETSVTLHHTYGIPYIPASALKGAIRNYVIQTEFKNESKALQNSSFISIFGDKDQKGKVIFFDAYPVGLPEIAVDVINVHYPDYYKSSKPPADYQDPNPVFFITVKNTSFEFITGIKKKSDENVLDKAFDYLQKALTEFGIGAKTSVGYGYFKERTKKSWLELRNPMF